jgi:hypothetical protein
LISELTLVQQYWLEPIVKLVKSISVDIASVDVDVDGILNGEV